MARKLRLDEKGGLYHVLNRGNYRRWIFEDEGAKQAFETTLFEACEHAGWVLHAFCVMSNHYHLALETPKGNLSEGMRWLQSVFANRFNRYRKENGHLFQGRFKSLLVEDRERLAWLCHYQHLNPVRARICPMESLAQYRWSSYWYLQHPKERPKHLRLSTCLDGAGGLHDTEAGRKLYAGYLAWLSEDEPARKQMQFDAMSQGWVIGSTQYQKAVVEDERMLRQVVKLTQAEARLVRHARWEAALATGLKRLRKTSEQIVATPKSAAWKVALAADLKTRLMCANGWLGQKLNMGAPAAVCRYVTEARQNKRPAVEPILKRLSSFKR